MRIQISHRTTYTYAQPASAIIQLLRLTPRGHAGQSVRRWRIDIDCDGSLMASQDAFGNTVHALSPNGPIAHLTVVADGEVDTFDTAGVIRDAPERFPSAIYLRETPLTVPSPEVRAYAAERFQAADSDVLGTMHRLLADLHKDVTFDVTPTTVVTTAAEAFAMKRGVCQDLTHIFIAAARSVGVPARYVSGYLWRADGHRLQSQEAGHAWAEALIPDVGWVGFDAANGISPTDAHVRVAIGLDYLGAAPVRGSRTGGPSETLDVAVQINHLSSQQ